MASTTGTRLVGDLDVPVSSGATRVNDHGGNIIMSTDNKINFPTADDYAAADKSEKGKIRSRVDAAMRAALDADDYATASAAHVALRSYVTVRPSATPADPTVVWANRIATAKMIFDGVVSSVPSDVDVTDVDGVSDDDTANKIISRIVGSGGPRNDVGQMILDALATVPVGTRLTVAQIAAAAGVDGQTFGGRINARVFPVNGKITLNGVVTFPADADHSARTVARTV